MAGSSQGCWPRRAVVGACRGVEGTEGSLSENSQGTGVGRVPGTGVLPVEAFRLSPGSSIGLGSVRAVTREQTQREDEESRCLWSPGRGPSRAGQRLGSAERWAPAVSPAALLDSPGCPHARALVSISLENPEYLSTVMHILLRQPRSHFACTAGVEPDAISSHGRGSSTFSVPD